MIIRDILDFLLEVAPRELSEEWDNVGLLVGGADDAVSRVLLALDITPAVVREAHEAAAQLIISHHPVIFEPLCTLAPDTAPYLLAQYQIAAICLHTNLDRAENGVNTALAKALGLRNLRFFPDEYLMIGEPEQPMEADAFAELIKDRLHAPSVRYTGGRVTRAAVSSGAGGGGVELCGQYGCDAFVTGEIKHHHWLYAADHGIAAFDAGHWCTENVVIEPLREMMSLRFPDISFLISEKNPCPYRAV